MRKPALILALGLGATSVVAAQRTHQFELGAFGEYTRYDRGFRLDNRAGGGARLGYFFSDVVGLEVGASFEQPRPFGSSAGGNLAAGSASVSLNFGGERNLFYLLGGYSRLSFTSMPGGNGFDDNAVHGAVGDRFFLGERVAVRLEARGIYAPSPRAPAGPPWAGHVVGSLGLSLFTGAGRPRDADADGVPDKRDACPNTPAGATADVHGCPSDSDGDSVYNGLDACPNTPPGARVDRTGCPLDSDSDGVYDGIDQCPNSPAGARVDAKGCPADGDFDGVPDGVDKCPNTPPGATVDAVGCPEDADRDGVFDGIDKCPNTPAGTQVDATGCPVAKDTDGDGVDDAKDKCPGTAAGTRVDAAGCPILFTPDRKPVILRGVTFETGKSALRSESNFVLDVVAQSLNDNPEIRIEIAGHTDNTGSPATNLRLSQARADAVRAYLASKGVSPERMVAKGYGSTQPIAQNATSAGRSQNRRVELRQIP
jgi:outer membrane protein OmpA-like peptidoglycan-associated protein